jgi:hypothetical protein
VPDSGTVLRLAHFTREALPRGFNPYWPAVNAARTPSIVPRGDDLGPGLARARLRRYETIVANLLSGYYKKPIGIFCFNAAEGWSRDVSADIAPGDPTESLSPSSSRARLIHASSRRPARWGWRASCRSAWTNPYRPGPQRSWVKLKNPLHPAMYRVKDGPLARDGLPDDTSRNPHAVIMPTPEEQKPGDCQLMSA